MKRKLGPLQLWQWILIGAVVGVGGVLYRRGHAGAVQNAAAAVTPSGAAYNPIDPTTGLPIAGGAATPPSGTSDDVLHSINDQLAALGGPAAQPSLADMLTNFQALEGLLGGLSELQGTSPPGDAAPTGDTPAKVQTGVKRSAKKKPAKPKAKAKKTTHAGHTNPGHHVTHHGGGRKTPRSSAPHNARQHHNVAAPAHQRHDATTHHSAQHPASRTGGAGHTPAVHPPAKRKAPAKRAAGKPAAAQHVTHVGPPAPHAGPAGSLGAPRKPAPRKPAPKKKGRR